MNPTPPGWKSLAGIVALLTAVTATPACGEQDDASPPTNDPHDAHAEDASVVDVALDGEAGSPADAFDAPLPDANADADTNGDATRDANGDADAHADTQDAAPAPGTQGALRPAQCAAYTPTVDQVPIHVIEAGWSAPERLPFPVNTRCIEDCPEVTSDGSGLFLCFMDRFYDYGSNDDVVAFLTNPVIGTYGTFLDGDVWGVPTFEDLGVGETNAIDMSTARSADGQVVYFHSLRGSAPFPIELYRSTRSGSGWLAAQRLPDPVNDGSDTGEAGVTPDGESLIFASRRAGGVGSQDMWISTKQGAGWSEPENLGPPINTQYEELMASVRADGEEMYFVSGGHNDAGDYHPQPGIYRVQRIDFTSWGPEAWGPPEWIVTGAVGEPSVTADGATLYFAHMYLDESFAPVDVDIYRIRRP